MAAAGNLLSPVESRPHIRRISSVTATREDLVGGPAILIPPKHMMAPGDAHETALALEMAKHHLDQGSSGESTPDEGTTDSLARVTTSPTTGQYAFAFDIDGVLIRGGKPIPQAIEAMKVLNGQNKFGVKV